MQGLLRSLPGAQLYGGPFAMLLLRGASVHLSSRRAIHVNPIDVMGRASVDKHLLETDIPTWVVEL